MSGIVLHGYWRSSASYRVRIALALKKVPYTQVTHDLRTGAQRDAAYRAIAPAGLVPALEVDGEPMVQSVAILEWLEERYPSPPLLPPSEGARAVVRSMVQTVACDVHPLNNLRVLRYLKDQLKADPEQISDWIGTWTHAGFEALEAMIARHGGMFAFGDTPTLADCMIVPQLYNAERFGVDVSGIPRVTAAGAALRSRPEIAAAHPDRQPDADPA
jgi:maleylpyruvate isomerase